MPGFSDVKSFELDGNATVRHCYKNVAFLLRSWSCLVCIWLMSGYTSERLAGRFCICGQINNAKDHLLLMLQSSETESIEFNSWAWTFGTSILHFCSKTGHVLFAYFQCRG